MHLRLVFSIWILIGLLISISNAEKFPYYSDIDSSYTLVWEDDFNFLNYSTWNVADNYYHYGNNEENIYITSNVWTDNGLLVLQSLQQWYNGYQYTSGWVDTYNKFSQVYGRFEIYAKLPFGKGMWPAHWMLPNDNSCWPIEGEIDIMECVGGDPGSLPPVYGTLHWSGNGQCSNNAQSGGTGLYFYSHPKGSFSNGENWSQDFHLFAVDWSPSEIEFSVDYKVYWTVPSSQFTPSVPFYMILNTAVGGDWPGSPDAYTTFPQYHYIDYVRAYQN